jgi:hypothetical protein
MPGTPPGRTRVVEARCSTTSASTYCSNVYLDDEGQLWTHQKPGDSRPADGTLVGDVIYRRRK